MPRRFLLFLLCAVLVVPMPPAWGQVSDFMSALSGTTRPLTIKVKNLDSTWRQMSVSKSSGLDLLSLFALGSRGQGPRLDLYYTRGETVIAGGETFLVTYRVSPGPGTLVALSDGNVPPPAPQTPDTVLSLSLVNVRQIGSLDGIQAYTPVTQAEAEAQTARDAEAVSLSNLKLIGLGMIQCVQDHDEKLPPMRSAAAAQKAILPYVKDAAVFRQPLTHEPYLSNTSLSGRSLESFGGLATMVVYYEASPMPDGTRAVVFLDGHAKRIRESDWPALKAASHVPNVPPR